MKHIRHYFFVAVILPALVVVLLPSANPNGSRFKVPEAGSEALDRLRAWMRAGASPNLSYRLSIQLAAAAFSVSYGGQDGKASVQVPAAGDWVSIAQFITRVSSFIAAHPDTAAASSFRSQAEAWKTLMEKLNNNTALVTPSNPAGCPPRFQGQEPA